MLNSVEATAEAVAATGLQHRVFFRAGERGIPLVVLVHGRTGDSRVMWPFSKAVGQHPAIVVAPQAPNLDPERGYAWWNHLLDRNSPEYAAELARATEQLEYFTHRAVEFYGADRTRILAMGFSQGAATISMLTLKEPELFQGIAMLSGFVPQLALDNANTEVWADAQRRPDVFIAHGRADEVVRFLRAEQARDGFTDLGSKVHFVAEDVGHKTGAAAGRELQGWFARQFVL